MTAFQETIKERKSLVPSSRRQKRGSRSRKVTLPHDNLSPAQLRKLNGKVETYRMRSPMTWEQFKALPDDLAQEYISFLEGKYRISTGALAGAFGVTSPPLRNQLEKKRVTFHSAKRMVKEDTEAFKKFWSGEPADSESAIEDVIVNESIPEEKSTPGNSAASQMRMSSFSLNFDGKFNSNNLIQTLILMIGEGSDCHIRIEVNQ